MREGGRARVYAHFHAAPRTRVRLSLHHHPLQGYKGFDQVDKERRRLFVLARGWEGFAVFREGVLMGIASGIIGANSGGSKLVCTFVVLLIAFAAQVVWKPYKTKILNHLTALALLGEIGMCISVVGRLTALGGGNSDIVAVSARDQNVFDILAIMCNIPFLALLFGHVLDIMINDANTTALFLITTARMSKAINADSAESIVSRDELSGHTHQLRALLKMNSVNLRGVASSGGMFEKGSSISLENPILLGSPDPSLVKLRKSAGKSSVSQVVKMPRPRRSVSSCDRQPHFLSDSKRSELRATLGLPVARPRTSFHPRNDATPSLDMAAESSVTGDGSSGDGSSGTDAGSRGRGLLSEPLPNSPATQHFGLMRQPSRFQLQVAPHPSQTRSARPARSMPPRHVGVDPEQAQPTLDVGHSDSGPERGAEESSPLGSKAAALDEEERAGQQQIAAAPDADATAQDPRPAVYLPLGRSAIANELRKRGYLVHEVNMNVGILELPEDQPDIASYLASRGFPVAKMPHKAIQKLRSAVEGIMAASGLASRKSGA